MGCTPQLQLALKAPPAPFPLLKGAPRAVRDGENKTQWSAPIGTVHLGCLRSPWWPEKGKKSVRKYNPKPFPVLCWIICCPVGVTLPDALIPQCWADTEKQIGFGSKETECKQIHMSHFKAVLCFSPTAMKSGGTQLKLIMTFQNYGQALFKPMK